VKVAALITLLDVAAQNRRTAGFHRPPHAALRCRQGSAIVLAERFSVAAEHLRHFPLGTLHGPPLSRRRARWAQ
jgi:hypothetical protein